MRKHRIIIENVALAVVVIALALAFWLATEAKAAPQSIAGTKSAICKTFGRYCSQALRVAHCESRYNIWARNGQYLGLFQMGNYARSRYGHSNNAWGQSRAAYRYFIASGRDWSPWACKP